MNNCVDAEESFRQAQGINPSLNLQKLIQECEMQNKKNNVNDYYKILGVDKKATAEQIRKQYKKLARLYHPDRNNESEDKR